jgi:hypothetical protein
MIRSARQQSLDVVMYKGLMYEYTKKQMYKDTSGTKKYFVSRTEEEVIFRDSKPSKIWEMPEKYYNAGGDPVKLFLMNNNMRGFLNKEYWKRKQLNHA